MRKIDYGQNCQLARYLEELSRLDVGGLQAQLSSALLFGLGYPHYIQPPSVTFIGVLLGHMAEDGHNYLLSEATERCMHCPNLAHCEIGMLTEARKLEEPLGLEATSTAAKSRG